MARLSQVRAASNVIYITAEPTPLREQYFLSANGSPVTVTGFYVDGKGCEPLIAFSGTVPANTGTAVGWDTIGSFSWSGTTPTTPVDGILAVFSAPVYQCLASDPATLADLKANPTRYIPRAANLTYGFGDVNEQTWSPINTLIQAVQAIPGSSGTPSHVIVDPGENHMGQVGGTTTRAGASFNRPADITQYAIGDLVANNVTAGSVVPMQFTAARIAAGSGMIRRAKIRKSGTSITAASFRLHLYLTLPTPSNGDNGPWLTDDSANYIGSFDATMDRVFTDGASGIGVPSVGSEVNFALASGQILYGLLEARDTYTPVSGETFTCVLEDLEN